MYAAVSWVPRGVASVKLPPGEDETASVPAAHPPPGVDEEDDSDGSVDIGDVLANDLDNLAVFKSNRDDPYLAGDDDACAAFDAEEMDDLNVRPTDALVVAAKSGDDASVLEFHLLEDNPAESDDEDTYKPHFYVHHDVVLPTLPLCTAVTSVPRSGNTRLNLVAVGCFTPGIDVWDVDLVNVLEPAAVLGGYDDDLGHGPAGVKSSRSKKTKSKKKRPKMKLKSDSHTDAVMSLCWNPLQCEYLASGSADCTVKIWDIESTHCARTLTHHSGKVQSVTWHSGEESTLLTGAFDRSVQILDVRVSDKPAHTSFAVDSDVESVLWGKDALEDRVLAATEDGMISIFDRRFPKAASASFRAHNAAVSTVSISSDVPGLMVTGSVDKCLKVWDTRPCAASASALPELVYERPSKAGAIFGSALGPVQGGPSASSPFLLAYAGAKGILAIADLAVESKAVRDRFGSSVSSDAAKVIQKRAARVAAHAKAREFNQSKRQAHSRKMADISASQRSDSSSCGTSESEWETDSDSEDC